MYNIDFFFSWLLLVVYGLSNFPNMCLSLLLYSKKFSIGSPDLLLIV